MNAPKETLVVCPPARLARRIGNWLRHTSGMYDAEYGPLLGWLDLAAGLNQLAIDDPFGDMCSGDAASGEVLAASERTHLAATRLLYAAAAVHGAVTAIDGNTEAAKCVDERVIAVLGRSKAYRFELWEGPVRCLITAEETSGSESLTEDDSLGIEVARVGLAHWQQFMCSGLRMIPSGTARDLSTAELQQIVVRAEAASTCLLMTLQRLMMMALDASLITPFEDTFDSGDLFWVRASTSGTGNWSESPGMREAIGAAHLE